MSTFSCPHFDLANDCCSLLETDCVPGRPGCVLRKNSTFAFPVEERIRAREEAKPPGEALPVRKVRPSKLA